MQVLSSDLDWYGMVSSWCWLYRALGGTLSVGNNNRVDEARDNNDDETETRKGWRTDTKLQILSKAKLSFPVALRWNRYVTKINQKWVHRKYE